METPKYTYLKPLENMPVHIYVDGIHDDYEGFRIILSGEKDGEGILRIKFDDPLIYRVSEEISIIGAPFDISKEWWFFKMNDSCFSTWFLEMSIHDDIAKDIGHYCIYAINNLIDVLSPFEPIVEWLNEPMNP